MTTTQEDIKNWFNKAQKGNCNYLLVACDTFDYGDYPLGFKSLEDLKERFNNPHPMEIFMECYDLSLDLDEQLNERRSWHPSKKELER